MEDVFKNPITFFSHVVGTAPFYYQSEFLKMGSKRIAIRSGRQVGKTVMAAVKALYVAYSHPHQQILIVAPTQRQAGILFRNIKTYISDHPEMFGEKLVKNTQTELWLENGSEIHCLLSGKQSGDNIRGFSPNLIIVDEAAFVAEDAFAAIEPSLASTQGGLILISTPWGQQGFFYDAFRPDSEYETMHIKSRDSPLITDDYLDKMKKNPRMT